MGWWYLGPAGQGLFYPDLANRFEAANPDVHVQVEALAPRSDLNQIVTQADTLLMPTFSPTLMRPSLLRDLTPFIESDKNLRVEDYYPVVRESLRRDGGIWALPADVNFHLIFYDKKAFDAAGVPYPEPGWTWEDLLTKAQALTEREGEEVTRWGFAWRGDPLPFARGRAGALLDTSVEPAVPLLDRPEVAEAVRWLTDLALTHQVMPVEVYGPVNFLTPTTAMWIASTQNWPNQNSKVGMVPMPVEDMEEEAFDITFDVNVKGVFLCCKAVIPQMKQQGSGKIINTASIGGKNAFPTLAHYCASKFAVVGFTNGLAKEVAKDNITVNAICPGIVRTAMWDLLADVWKQPGESVEESWQRHLDALVPQGRGQTPADMGSLAVFFATNDNITGQAFNVDGGTELH